MAKFQRPIGDRYLLKVEEATDKIIGGVVFKGTGTLNRGEILMVGNPGEGKIMDGKVGDTAYFVKGAGAWFDEKEKLLAIRQGEIYFLEGEDN